MRRLGDLEAVVMEILWSTEGSLRVRDVLERLERDPPLAYTTILTVMDNLHRKGFLTRDRAGRAYRYQPAQGRAEFTAEVMHELLSESGDTSSTLLTFIDQMSPVEIARLKRALSD